MPSWRSVFFSLQLNLHVSFVMVTGWMIFPCCFHFMLLLIPWWGECADFGCESLKLSGRILDDGYWPATLWALVTVAVKPYSSSCWFKYYNPRKHKEHVSENKHAVAVMSSLMSLTLPVATVGRRLHHSGQKERRSSPGWTLSSQSLSGLNTWINGDWLRRLQGRKNR